MILRRVIEHMKKQHWTAIFLDFVIVVLGVFIGIQVSNWNAAQADIRRGEDYAERLSADLEYDLIGRKALVVYFDEVNNSLEKTLALLADPDSDPKELVANAYRSTEYTKFPQTRAAWEEIVSAGELRLLPHEAIEGGLIFYFGGDISEETALEVISSPLRRRVRSILPHAVQIAIREGCSDIRDERFSVVRFVEECRIDSPKADIAAAAQALRQDPELIRDLQFHASALNSARANLRGDVAVLEKVIALLGAHDKKTRK